MIKVYAIVYSASLSIVASSRFLASRDVAVALYHTVLARSSAAFSYSLLQMCPNLEHSCFIYVAVVTPEYDLLLNFCTSEEAARQKYVVVKA